MKKKTRRIAGCSQDGFSLVEVLIAVFILSVGVMALTSMQTVAIKGNAAASRISSSSSWAADRIEQIFALDYDDLQDNESADGTSGTGDGLAGLQDETDATADAKDPAPPAGYEIYWNVAEDEPMPLTKTIRVIVKRSDQGGTKRVVYDYIKAWVVKP